MNWFQQLGSDLAHLPTLGKLAAIVIGLPACAGIIGGIIVTVSQAL